MNVTSSHIDTKLIFENYILLEKISEAKKLVQIGKLTQEVLDSIIEIDPTPQKKYVFWMAKQWSDNQIKDMSVLKNTIEEFETFSKRKIIKEKDIFQYKTFDDLKKVVDIANQGAGAISVKELESDYEVIKDDENLLIMVPHTHEASRKLGLTHFKFRDCGDGTQDSAWCTTYKAPDHWNEYYYNQDMTFYYIKVKSFELTEKLKKHFDESYRVVALAVFPNGKNEAWNGRDEKFSGQKLENYKKIINLN
jgi:hypothetical protein